MRVGISLLTLVPGEVGGAETSARGLARALGRGRARSTTRRSSPPAAAGAGEGLPEVLVLRVPARAQSSRSAPSRWRSPRCARARLRRRSPALDARPLPAHDRASRRSSCRRSSRVHDLQHLDLPQLFSRAERLFRRARLRGLGPQRRRGGRAEPVRPPQRRRAARPAARARPRDPAGALDHARFRPGDERARAVPALPGAALAAQEPRAAVRGARAAPGGAARAAARAHGRRPRGPAGAAWSEVRGLVSAEELVSLYRRAACLVFPSLYEGFGQPPLEAMACGCPVAASNMPPRSRRRVGEAAALFDPQRARGHRRGRRRRARRARSGFVAAGPRARAAASPGPRRPAGTKRSTARSCSAAPITRSSGSTRPSRAAIHGWRSRAGPGFSIANGEQVRLARQHAFVTSRDRRPGDPQRDARGPASGVASSVPAARTRGRNGAGGARAARTRRASSAPRAPSSGRRSSACSCSPPRRSEAVRRRPPPVRSRRRRRADAEPHQRAVAALERERRRPARPDRARAARGAASGSGAAPARHDGQVERARPRRSGSRRPRSATCTGASVRSRSRPRRRSRSSRPRSRSSSGRHPGRPRRPPRRARTSRGGSSPSSSSPASTRR